MDWCHFVLLKKTTPKNKKRALCLEGFCCLFPPYPPLYFKSKDVRDSVGGAISFQRQLCSNSQTLNHYPFNNLKNSLKIIAQFPSMNQGKWKKGKEGAGSRKRKGGAVWVSYYWDPDTYTQETTTKQGKGSRQKLWGYRGKKKTLKTPNERWGREKGDFKGTEGLGE